VSRRVGLPGASELFRPTTEKPTEDPKQQDSAAAAVPAASGRVRHDEKITVYISSEELLALEQVRLELRSRYGLAVDRGRIVRAAIADAVADVAEAGADSALVRRLRQQ
jgi:hypothetical protein